MTPVDIRVLTADEADALTVPLGAILADCVNGGASVNFLLPYGADDGQRFFAKVARQIHSGETLLMAAFRGDEIVGTAQLGLEQPPNQRHRADVKKVLVPRQQRGHGIGAALMRALEEEARRHGRSLLCLDTEGGSAAERLYRRLGWQELGVIPGFARNIDGGLKDCVFFWKALAP